MPSGDSFGVTLAHVDPLLLSCWEGMVKRGEDCSLLLKHSNGKVIATLSSIKPITHSSTSSSTSAKRKKKKRDNKKKLEKLLAYHQRLVVEKGLPPSRLMEEHAAASSPEKKKKFKCDQCNFESESQRGLKYWQES